MIIVLAPGIFGFDELRFGSIDIPYFRDIPQSLANLGHSVITTGVNPIGAIDGRAKQLRQQINQKINTLNPAPADTRILLIGYSMGGLDARHMLSALPPDPAPALGSRVVALVTICTPHRGSPIADPAQPFAAAGAFAQANSVGAVAKMLGGLTARTGAVGNLTTAFCTQFNRTTRNAPGVKYFCVGGDCASGVPLYFGLTHPIIRMRQGANDGVVSVQSAHPDSDPDAASVIGPWITLPNWPVDHLAAANMKFPGAPPSPDVPGLYVNLLSQLQAHGVA